MYELPDKLESYREELKAMERETLQISATKTKEPLSRYKSKIGGKPYLPKGVAYPVNKKGQPLFHLAQINFRDLPENNLFPAKGILQFYVNNGRAYGMSFSDPLSKDNNRVLYFPEPDYEIFLEGNIPEFNETSSGLPLKPGTEAALEFTVSSCLPSAGDYLFENKMGKDFFDNISKSPWELRSIYSSKNPGKGHRLGGHPLFTQWDPRPRFPEDDFRLLLQLDTDSALDMMWGDMGVCHFMLKQEDWENHRFDNAWFHWDCL